MCGVRCGAVWCGVVWNAGTSLPSSPTRPGRTRHLQGSHHERENRTRMATATMTSQFRMPSTRTTGSTLEDLLAALGSVGTSSSFRSKQLISP
mmetsp:Transcript_28200/g.93628  ORF Transcript_28200/g.93628 Transcript_28200/m.93628 type:complete len:93 (+) Transcript_28200:95-373(+)